MNDWGPHDMWVRRYQRVPLLLHTAMTYTNLPERWSVDAKQLPFSAVQSDEVTLSLLGCAHYARYHKAGILGRDPRVAGDTVTREERIYRDLLNAWPVLAVRARYVPGLMVAMKRNHKMKSKPENALPSGSSIWESNFDWSVFNIIQLTGRPIIQTFRELNL